MPSLLFIVLTIVFTVVGQLTLKIGMVRVGEIPHSVVQLPSFFLRAMFSPFVFGGLLLAVAAALSWMAAVSKSDLSFAYPFMSLAIVLVLALSRLILGESVPFTRWIGVVIVCIGILVASR